MLRWLARAALALALFLYFGAHNGAEKSFWYAVACLAVYYAAKYAYVGMAGRVEEGASLAAAGRRNAVELSHERARGELRMENFRQMAEIAAKMRDQEADVTRQVWELRKQIADAEREENAEFARQMRAILDEAGLA